MILGLLFLLLVCCSSSPSQLEVKHEDPDGSCWLYMHLEKSGGMTVRGSFLNPDGKTRQGPLLFYSNQWRRGDAYIALTAASLGISRSRLSGSCIEGLRRFSGVGEKCKFFTLFRHPVSRLVSAYYFCQYRPQDQLCASSVVRADEIDLLTFAKHWGNHALREFMFAHFAADDVLSYIDRVSSTDGKLDGVPVEDIPAWYLLKIFLMNGTNAPGFENDEAALLPMLALAQDAVSSYTAVGLTEHFLASFMLFDAALDIPGKNWTVALLEDGGRNTDTKYKVEAEEARREALLSSEIQKYIRLDLLLYEHAAQVFRYQLEQYAIDYAL